MSNPRYIMSLDNSPFRNRSNCKETNDNGYSCYLGEKSNANNLYPYKRPRKPKTKTWIQLNIYGSAIVAAHKQLIIIGLLNIALSLLLVFEIVDSNIFPLDQFAFGHFFSIYTFLVAIYYSVAYTNNRNALEEYIIGMMGNTVDAAINVSSLATDTAAYKPVWKYVYNRHTSKITVEKTKVICLIEDISFILKSIPYATKHKYRPGSDLEPDKLPMPQELRDELIVGINRGMNGLDKLRALYLDRIGRMIDVGALPLPSIGNCVGKSDTYGTNIGKIDFLTVFAAMQPILKNLTLVSLWIYSLYLTFALWEPWAIQVSIYAYYPVLLLIVSFILSLFSAINTINNPFQDPETSNFLSIDLGAIANETAETVDVNFELTREQLEVFNNTKGFKEMFEDVQN